MEELAVWWISHGFGIESVKCKQQKPSPTLNSTFIRTNTTLHFRFPHTQSHSTSANSPILVMKRTATDYWAARHAPCKRFAILHVFCQKPHCRTHCLSPAYPIHSNSNMTGRGSGVQKLAAHLHQLAQASKLSCFMWFHAFQSMS